MPSYLKNIYYILKRMVIYRKRWVYDSLGFCPACSMLTVFAYSKEAATDLRGLIDDWDYCSSYKDELLARENYFCINCIASIRVRSLSGMILKLIGLKSCSDLILKLSGKKDFKVYETATYNVFRVSKIKTFSNYIISEYFENEVFGKYVNGVRNENLECLSFEDNTFDVLITSDVLEHVADLDKAISEIYRVLKPNGLHIFTIPVNYCLDKSIERARIEDGSLVNLAKPVMHGDSIRENGILAFRDFGKDVLDFLTRDSFLCEEQKYYKNGKFITSVFYARKQC
jgi:SAM-dependent methyltransferase